MQNVSFHSTVMLNHIVVQLLIVLALCASVFVLYDVYVLVYVNYSIRSMIKRDSNINNEIKSEKVCFKTFNSYIGHYFILI